MTGAFAARRAALVVLLVLAGLLAMITAQPASAATSTEKVDVTGAVFTCEGGVTYEVVSGDAVFLMHESTDANNGTHITGTIAPGNVLLVGSDGQTYRLAGAAWFGANFNANNGYQITDTEFFSIVTQGGGVVAKVSLLFHITATPDGTISVEFDRNRGQCFPPEDDEEAA